MEKINIREEVHHGVPQQFIYFQRDPVLQEELKKLKGVRFSGSKRAWYTDAQKLQEVLLVLRQFPSYEIKFEEKEGKEVEKQECVKEERKEEKRREKSKPQPETPREEVIQKLEELRSWMRSKRYSDSTIVTYIDSLRTFFKYFDDKDSVEITNEDLIEFNNRYILKNKLSASFQNQVVNAVKLFCRITENKKLDPELIHRPKRAKVLPNVLSKEEVKAILSAHSNIKHKAMLSLIYSCGLRCGELIKLKPEDVDGKRGLLLVKQAKGRKDRIVPLSPKILQLLREYYIACKPEIYLFEGQKKGEPYDERSLQQVLKQSLRKCNITKPVSLHWLRHSYATHLLENGTDLRYIQEILGHTRSTTTEIYTHVSNLSIQKVVSPFDTL